MKPLHFIQINKTGTTAISFALGIKPKQHHTRQHFDNDGFTFAFVRNPFDRLVSMYEYRKNANQQGIKEKNITFHQWVVRAFELNDKTLINREHYFWPQTAWLTKDGVEDMDFIGRFDRLQADYEELCKKIGVTPTKLNKVNRTHRKPYQEYYDAKTKFIVREHFKSDLQRFEYAY